MWNANARTTFARVLSARLVLACCAENPMPMFRLLRLSHRACPMLAVGLLASWIVACSDGGSNSSKDTAVADDTAQDSAAVDSSQADGDDATDNDTSTPDDVADADDATDSVGGDTGPGCPGAVGCACTDAASCNNGACMMDQAGEQRCAPACSTDGDCVTGVCAEIDGKDGKIKVCADQHAALCAPCKADSECQVPGAATAACVRVGGAGAFCSVGCAADSDCPNQSTCAEVQNAAGDTVKQCTPKQAGACTCSGWAKAHQAATTCWAEGLPGCTAEISCGETGLSACAPAAAATETCDGVDQDCDGSTDQGDALCDDDNACTADACAKGACSHLPQSGDCSDGDACTEADSCDAGSCKAGLAANCADGNPCTDDSCDSAKGCVQLPNKVTCDDVDACTSGDVCALGLCAGVTVSCDDSDPCTDDACDSVKGCSHTQNTAPCDDGDKCTDKDTCGKGVCGGIATNCDDKNICTLDACDSATGCSHVNNLAPCDDGDACTTGESCKAGKCQSGAAACDDGKPCTVDSCDKATGACTNAPAPGTTACDDGDPCTTGDACKAGACVGTAKDCPGGTCNIGVCQGGTCAQLPKLCDDGDPCTTDSCDPQAGCKAAPATCSSNTTFKLPYSEVFNCNSASSKLWVFDGDQTSPAWAVDATPALPKPSKGSCSLNFNDGTDYKCKGSDMSVYGIATSPPIDLTTALKPKLKVAIGGDWEDGGFWDTLIIQASGDGGKTWTSTDFIDSPTTNPWKEITVDLSLQIGTTALIRFNFKTYDCTLNGTAGPFIDWLTVYDAGGCTTDEECYDGDSCTVDTCDKTAAVCKNAPQLGASCDDGNYCTAKDTCDATGTCKGTAASCDDGNGCTTDTCDSKTGKCQYALFTGDCDDGKKCTINDSCDVGVCVSGPAQPCDDGDACTTDACDNATGQCKFAAVANCVASCTSDGDCGDGNPCTVDSCDLATNKCKVQTSADGAVCGSNATCSKGTCAAILGGDVVQIASGHAAYHTCARKAAGSVWCWGYNNNGQLGDDTTTNANAAVQVKGINAAVDITGGYYHSCAVAANGRVYCWGDNLHGQLGDGTTTDSKVPVEVKELDGVVQVRAGYYHTCALKVDGSVWCWGYNNYGQLGVGDTTETSKATRLNGVSGVKALATGYYHTVALRQDGTVWSWGYNASYQTASGSTASALAPKLRTELGFATAVSAGYDFTCALNKAGEQLCVGDNSQGQRGDGAKTTTDSPKATKAVSLKGVAILSSGYGFNAVLLPGGQAMAMGDNAYGQLGDGTTTDADVPRPFTKLSNLVDLTAGRYHTCALRKDGTVWCSGYNIYGQLGDGTTANKSAPVKVDFGGCKADSECADDDPCVVETCGSGVCAGSPAKAGVSCDDGDGCTVDDACDGNGACLAKPKNCDDNNACTLLPVCEVGVCKQTVQANCDDANDCTVDACDPKTGACTYNAVPNCKLPCKADADCADQNLCTVESCVGGFCQGKAGNDNVLCGAAKACSNGTCGALQLSGSYKAIASGTMAYHTCGIRTDGKLDCWGYNTYGQIGDGTTTVAKVPVNVAGLADVVQVALGYAHTCAVTSGGKLYCWGYNTYSQIGDGGTTAVKAPYDTGLKDVVSVAAGYGNTCALKADSTLWCWGMNGDGQVGDGTSTTQKAPTQVLGNVKHVDAGSYHTLALLGDGTVWAWGQNTYFNTQAGSSTADVLTPTKRGAFPGARAVAATGYSSCVVFGSGKVQCWGRNSDGQLGKGSVSSASDDLIADVQDLAGAVKVVGGQYHAIALRSDGEVLGWGSSASGELGLTSTEDQPQPVQMPYIGNVIDIAAGRSHSCVLRKDGAVFCTGDALYGQIGNNTTTDSTQLVHVEDGLCSADAECNTTNKCNVGTCDGNTGKCSYQPAKADSACDDEDACMTTDVCNGSGACVGIPKDCDDGDACTLSPACKGGICSQTAKVDCNDGNACTTDACDSKTGACSNTAIADCKIPCATDGDCDDGDPCSKETCMAKVCTFKSGNDGAVCGIASTCAAGSCKPLSQGWATRIAGFAYSYHVCAVRADKTAACWGRNTYGQLGDGTTTQATSPVAVSDLKDVEQIQVGTNHTCARLASGKVWCWGYNSDGQVGNGSTGTAAISKPVEVANLSDVVDLALGYYHTCALRKDGTVWCWGQNSAGQMGSGATSTTDVTAPTQVPGISGAVSIAAGYSFVCATLANRNVLCWGSNAYNQVDPATTSNVVSPMLRSDIKLTRGMGLGAYTACATDIYGVGRCYGYNNYGQTFAGDTVTPKTSPVSLAALGTLAQVQAGYYHSVSLGVDGTVQAVGYNLYGQLGDGTTTNSTTPAQMQGGSGAVQVVTFYHGTCVLKADGSVECAGYNTYGTVGDGTTTSAKTLTLVKGTK